MNIVEEHHRFAVYDNDREVGEMTYSEVGNNFIIIDHTFVDYLYRGNGLAEQLVFRGVKKARNENKKIIPLCPFAKKEFLVKKEYSDVWKQD
ncbi:GNAT family N-acetyltransferase [Enterococcus faecium]|uniref:GNAT family N-acetyltransferase n=1 Tax=Enterococcus faecium TaxID=1352 RepID=UPI0009BFF5D8|nr:GNAT family N-acetyltransferase [Enterococcus faecium]OQO64495.1 GNAT family N-acetyltransferase [Enterococcus faecium]